MAQLTGSPLIFDQVGQSYVPTGQMIIVVIMLSGRSEEGPVTLAELNTGRVLFHGYLHRDSDTVVPFSDSVLKTTDGVLMAELPNNGILALYHK